MKILGFHTVGPSLCERIKSDNSLEVKMMLKCVLDPDMEEELLVVQRIIHLDRIGLF